MMSPRRLFWPRRRLLLIALPVLLVASAWAQAEDRPFGISLRFPPEAVIASVAPAKSSVSASRGYRAEVQDLERYLSEVGPFHPSLAPKQLRLARLFVESGERDVALKYYRATLYNLRVNGGLNDPAQVPVLEELMALLRAQGDVEMLRSYSDELFRLQGRGTQPFNEQGLQGLASWLDRETELLLSSEADARWLLSTYERAESWRETICADEAWRASWCRVATERVIALLYLIDYWIEPVVITDTRYGAYERETRSLDNWRQSPIEQKLLNLERRVVSLGSTAIEQAMVIDDAVSLIQLAADWAWYHNQRSAAAAHWAALVERGVALDEPAPVPTVLGSLRDPLLADAWVEAHISATISASGRVRECSASVSSASESISTGYVCRQLRDTRFRPAIDADGRRLEMIYESPLVVLRD